MNLPTKLILILAIAALSCSTQSTKPELRYYFPYYGECGFTKNFLKPLPREIMGDSGHYNYYRTRFFRDPGNMGIDLTAPEGTEIRSGVTGCLVYYGPDTAYGRLVAAVSVDVEKPLGVVDGVGRNRDVSRFVVLYGNIRPTRDFNADSNATDTRLRVGDRIDSKTTIGWIERGSRNRDSAEYLFYAIRLQSWKDAWTMEDYSPLARKNEHSALAQYYTDPALLFSRE